MEFFKELEVLELKKSKLTILKNRLDDLYKDLSKEEKINYQLKKSLNKEFKEYKQIDDTTITSLFYGVIGKRQEKLEKEKQEYLQAKLKYDQSKYVVKDILNCIQESELEVKNIGNLNKEYRDLLKQREDYLLNNSDSEAKKIREITEGIKLNNKEIQEYEEAIDAGYSLLFNFKQALSYMESAENMGVWDMVGGGMLADISKHSNIDDAQKVLNHSRFLSQRFNKELKDIDGNYSYTNSVELEDISRFGDMFFDSLIMDFGVQGKIENSIINIKKGISNVKRILDSLSDGKKNLVNKNSTYKKEWEKVIIGA